jgi:hypothetical protein
MGSEFSVMFAPELDTDNITSENRMKNTIIILLGASLIMPCITHASITTTPNANITAIFGGGNPNGGWQEVTDTDKNLQIGLRAKERSTGSTANNGAGNYTVASPWNYEFSVNVDPNNAGGVSLASSGYTFLLNWDANATPINLSSMFNDNAYGNNSTSNGKYTLSNPNGGIEGTSATSATLQSAWSLMQNSEREIWLGIPTDGSGHTLVLSVLNQSGSIILDDSITVNGGFAPVPEPSTVLAGALLLLPFGVSTLRKLRNSRTA